MTIRKLFYFICAAALLLCACRDQKPVRQNAQSRAPGRPANPSSDGSAEKSLFRWNSEQSCFFALQMDGDLKGAEDAVLLLYQLTATIAISAATHPDGSQTLHLRMINPVLSIDGQASQKQKAGAIDLQAELQHGVSGLFTKGQLQKLEIPQKASVFGVGIWRSLLSTLQIADTPGNTEAFDASEWDENGQYVAHYEFHADEWRKTKKKYLKGLQENTPSLMGTAPRPVIVQSSGSFRIKNNELLSLVRSETVDVHIAANQKLTGRLNLRLIPAEAGSDNRDAVPGGEGRRTLTADEPFFEQLPIDAMDAARMGNLTFDEVLKALAEKAADPRRQKLIGVRNEEPADSRDVAEAKEWTGDWSRFFSALPAFFRQKPETVRLAIREIRSGSPATTSLLGGLSAAGNAASQEALLSLIGDRKLPDSLRTHAMRNLIQCAHPQPSTATAVLALYDNALLKRYVVFGTGTIARKLRLDGHVDEAEQSLKWLLGLLKENATDDEQRDALQAISNSGHPSAFAPMKNLLSSTSDQIRAGALEGMRLIDHPDVESLYISHLDPALETSGLVRRAVLQSCAGRKPTDKLVEALLETAGNDPDELVRKEAGRTLQAFRGENPAIQSRLDALRATQ